jgi:DNA-binding response OmpR family regulator
MVRQQKNKGGQPQYMDYNGNMQKILILDDDGDFRKLLITYLGSAFKDTKLVEYDPIEKGLPGEDFDWSGYDVLILDYNLRINDLTGLDVLQANSNNRLFPATIMLTSEGDEDIAVQALKLGVYDYLRKEKLSKEKLKTSVEETFDKYCSNRNRLYSLDEARQLARKEAQKILAVYKAKYKQIRTHEETRLKAERLKLEEELEKNQTILDEIRESRNKVEQSKSTTDEEIAELKIRQEEAEAAVQKTKWKKDQEEKMKLLLEEDLNSFKDEMEQQKNLTLNIEARMERIQQLKEEAKVAAESNNKSLFNDIASQLGKDE